MIALLLLFLVIGVPVGMAFSLPIILHADSWNVSLEFIAQTSLDTLLNYPYLAIPLFMLGGELMTRGGLTVQLVRFSKRLLRWTNASTGHIMIGASTLMGAITGSSVACVAAIGRAIGPEMLRRGYPPGYVGALNASTGLLGVLLPPSIPLILYGSSVGVSITRLFLATLVPAFLFIAVFALVHTWRSRVVLEAGKESDPTDEDIRLPSISLMSALPALIMPVVVLGGIYTGIFTPTEAAAVAAAYALFYMLLRRTASLATIGDAFVKAAASSSAVMFIIGFTALFNRALTLEQIPQQIAALAMSFTDSPIMFLLIVNLALLFIGMFMETSAATLLMGPLLAPAAAQYGIDPIHFGIILVINIEIGLLTPPLATNLYVASLVNRVKLLPMIRHVGWFFLACLVCLTLITYIPEIALWYHILPGY